MWVNLFPHALAEPLVLREWNESSSIPARTTEGGKLRSHSERRMSFGSGRNQAGIGRFYSTDTVLRYDIAIQNRLECGVLHAIIAQPNRKP
jgi:hypothetical protein